MDIKLVKFEEIENELKKTLQQCLHEEMGKVSVNRESDYLTSKEVCEVLGISVRQFQKYRDERRIAFSQVGRKILVKRSDLEFFIAKHRIASRYELKKGGDIE